jgi:glycosyltransferase involved in cell wall biosynthesis
MAPPLFSIITPVWNPLAADFEACANSVIAQTSSSWEWIIVDDGSTDADVIDQLARLARDARVVVARHEHNQGITAATNTAIERASGTFLVFLDHDDELTSNALGRIAAAIDQQPDVDFLYSDETKIDAHGNEYDWFAKPEWSLERLRSQNYCNHLTVLRRTLVNELGGIRPGFEGAQDHDLVLRVAERTQRIVHVPEVLYRWRAAAGSTAAAEDAKPDASNAGCAAVREHLARLGIDADVVATRPGRYRSIRTLQQFPKVSLIIPTRGDAKRVQGRPLNLVINTVRSVVENSTYPDIEVVVVYDSSTAPSVLESLRDIDANIVLVEWTESFDFARKTNLGVMRSSGDIIVLLNDDTEVISPDWLHTLVGLLAEPSVGMVGPMLLLADGRIQSAGHHYAPTPFNLGNGAPADDPGPHALFAIAGERTGVTAACAGIRRSVYVEMGGLSEQFPNCYNDVDLGFKLLDAGYRIVWTPHASLFHFESQTRTTTETPQEARELELRWAQRLGNDPFAKQVNLWWAHVPFVQPTDQPDTEQGSY